MAKNGVPQAKIVHLPTLGAERTSAGALDVNFICEDFDASDPAPHHPIVIPSTAERSRGPSKTRPGDKT
jgi:hypothetical protein